nr:Rrf2 family transcriptional regulator [Streptococcus suis]
MKLSKAGLVSANASKAGGYQLGRSIEEISLKDVFYALQLHEDTIQFKHLSHSIFDDQAHVEESENKIRTTLENGLAAFYAQLDQLTLSQLLHQEAYENGAIDWEGRIK